MSTNINEISQESAVSPGMHRILLYVVLCCMLIVLTIRPDTEYLLQYSVETDAGAKQWFIFSQIGAPAVHGQTRMSLSLQ